MTFVSPKNSLSENKATTQGAHRTMKPTRIVFGLALILSLVTACIAQIGVANTFKARFDPVDYSKWQLVIYSSVIAGTSTVQVSYSGATLNTGPQTACTFKAVNGRTYSPIAIGVPITINDSSSETVTPTAVVNSATGCSFTATLTYAHGAGILLSSGTFGLQEAIQDAFAMGGGTVVADPFWSALGGTDALLSAALPYTGVTIEDDRKGSPQYWNALPSTTSLLAAPTTLTSQAACDATHQFCSDPTVAGSASWGGTVHGCITLVDLNGNESPCSADASFTSVASKAINIGTSFTARTDNVVGWKPYLSVSGGSYALSYSLPLLTQPTVLLAVPVSTGVCTLTTLETTTPACAIANSKYAQSGSTTGAAGTFLGGAQFTGYPVVTNMLAPEIGSVSALQHNPNEEAHATYAYVPGSRIGVPGIQAQHIVFPITAAAQTTIGEVVGSIPLPASFMNFIGRTVEVCGTIAKTSTTADTVDEIQVWWDAEGSNVTAGTPVQLSSIKITEAVALAAAANFQFCQQLTTTVASTSATGGSIAPGLGFATVSQVAAGANPSAGSSATSGTAVGSLNLALPAHLTIELKHTTGTDGAGATLLRSDGSHHQLTTNSSLSQVPRAVLSDGAGFDSMDKKPKRHCIAVDIDKTLAEYQDGDVDRYGVEYIGAPIPEMIAKVKAELAKGTEIYIFTARVNSASDSYEDQLNATLAMSAITDWCKQHIGVALPIAHRKLYIFDEFWDDRARQVIPNTGVFATELLAGHGAHR
jgi:hypothetical protein